MAVAEQAAIPVPAKRKQASQSYLSLVWWKFRKNRVAVVGGVILLVFYFCFVIIPEFVAPYSIERTSALVETAPSQIHFRDEAGNFRMPFVYRLERKIDTVTRTRTYVEDRSVTYPLGIFVRGDEYRLLGFIPLDIHLFGVANNEAGGNFFLMGTDALGRDWFTRII